MKRRCGREPHRRPQEGIAGGSGTAASWVDCDVPLPTHRRLGLFADTEECAANANRPRPRESRPPARAATAKAEVSTACRCTTK